MLSKVRKILLRNKFQITLNIEQKILKDMYHQGVLTTSKKKNAEDEKGIFEMYYAYSEPIKRIANHRVLAVNRGEKRKYYL